MPPPSDLSGRPFSAGLLLPLKESVHRHEQNGCEDEKTHKRENDYQRKIRQEECLISRSVKS
jgi:hypothetical protein